MSTHLRSIPYYIHVVSKKLLFIEVSKKTGKNVFKTFF